VQEEVDFEFQKAASDGGCNSLAASGRSPADVDRGRRVATCIETSEWKPRDTSSVPMKIFGHQPDHTDKTSVI
jgi:hypothetical protein